MFGMCAGVHGYVRGCAGRCVWVGVDVRGCAQCAWVLVSMCGMNF